MEDQFVSSNLTFLAIQNKFFENKCEKILYQQLFSWLSTSYNMNIAITRVAIDSDTMEFSYILNYLPKEHKFAKKRWVQYMVEVTPFEIYCNGTYTGAWDTWYIAADEALIKAFKLI